MEKRNIYARILPEKLMQMFQIPPDLKDQNGKDLLFLNCPAGSSVVEIALYHQIDAQDPILYVQFMDTLNGQLHILFYAVNDPASPRFDVDRMPDGSLTMMGTLRRNREAEVMAMDAGLAPAQIRRGLHMLSICFGIFEVFVKDLGHNIFYAEPLHYHNACVFERYGLAYQQGHKLMKRIQEGFAPGGDLIPLLDRSTPFRSPCAADSLRLRSWAVHDGILGEPFQNVTMYKIIGKHARVNTFPDDKRESIPW
jgi:hypothetical protein